MTLKTEILSRHIEALDYLTFRELARKCLALRGFSDSAISDGTGDGGRDLRVYNVQHGLATMPFAVQTSVERRWKAKLKDDAKKALDVLGCHSFMYVTSRRIPDAEFRPLVDSVRSDWGISLSKMDQQDLASLVLDNNLLQWFFNLAGLDVGFGKEEGVTIRQEVVEAFMMFSTQTRDFRQKMVEQAALVCAGHDAPCTRPHLERSMITALGLSGRGAEAICAGAIDRLIQQEHLCSRDGVITVDPEKRRSYAEARKLAETQWSQLACSIKELLDKYTPTPVSDDSSKRLAEQVGRILLSYREYQAAVLKSSRRVEGEERSKYIKEIKRCISFALQEGVPEQRAESFINDLSQLADTSEIVGRLTAGEVFRRLVSVDRSSLIRALGGNRSLELWLEPSVIIPLVCAKLFGTATDRFGRIALSLYDFADALCAKLSCPDVYLEETAAHLIEAAPYTPLIEAGEARHLTRSENAFVSFYARLSAPGRSFHEFLKSFGLREGTSDFHAQRDAAVAYLTTVLRRYKIGAVRLIPSSLRRGTRIRAEEDLAYIYREMNENRPSVLMKHDARVLAYLRSRASEEGSAYILATWDGTLLRACKRDQLDWWALEPASLADLLALTNSEGTATAGISWEIALSVGQDVEERASKIWDSLVKLEGDGLNDADRLAKARHFKEEYLQKQQGADFRRIKTAWLKWEKEGEPLREATKAARAPKVKRRRRV